MRKGIATEAARFRTPVRRAVLLLAVLTLVLGAYLYGRSQSPPSVPAEDQESAVPAGFSQEDDENVALYAEALKVVSENYLHRGALEPEELTYEAIRGMLDSLGDERHTGFLTPEDAEYVNKGSSNREVGIGVKLQVREGKIVVSSLMDGSPAQEAGIEPGDVLVAVDGESVQDEDFGEIAERVRDPEGSRVGLTVLRDGEQRVFSLESAEFDVQPASWNLVPSTGTAHLRLASFSEDSAEGLDEAITEAVQAGAERFVLDLRDNTGGYVEEAEGVAARFLPAGSVIYVQRDADGEEEERLVPEGNEPSDASLVVLVDGGSSSSAEIVAGALKDNNRAKVVGETTYGLGTVVRQYPLGDGSAVSLATDEWLTADGASIQDTGVAPDVQARPEEGQGAPTPAEGRGLSREEIFAKDPQLRRAFDVLWGG
ncbi:MAG: S41 family peptidase [Actinomycetota bacterium]|nr:S41 family peptidase [Actinomycetota bacterium]